MNSLKTHWLWLLIGVGYLLTHLIGLTTLPIFADEAIYLRWSQLIISDWQQYLFYPLNDGKTPLQIWLHIPFLKLLNDPLFAGRLVSVLAGLGQVFVTALIVKELGGKRTSQVVAALLVTFLPFWFFHHRMALLDATMTLFASVSLWACLKLGTHLTTWPDLLSKKQLVWISIGGLFFGLALWTKLPAILFAPIILSTIVLKISLTKLSPAKIAPLATGLLSIVGVGVALFGTLALTPVFGQLFNRGSDFLFPWQEVVVQGKWQETLPSLPTYVGYFSHYLSWPVVVLAVLGTFSTLGKKASPAIRWAWLGWLLFAGPIMLMGRVVFPRYLFPGVLFVTIAAALHIEVIWQWLNTIKNKYQLWARLAVFALLSPTIATTSYFVTTSWVKADQVPFVAADQMQYLTEWSSGHGIKEFSWLVQQEAEQNTVAVATEGSFGTLPDGVNVYLFNKDVSNIAIEGIGQPVRSVPDTFIDRAIQFDQTWLLVNSHRMSMSLPDTYLITEFCRPYNAPCLQLWDITWLTE